MIYRKMKSKTILFTYKAERKLLLHWSKKHEEKLMHDLFSQGSLHVCIKYLQEVSLHSICAELVKLLS